MVRPCSSLTVIFPEDPSPSSPARRRGVRKKKVAATVLAIRAICRRFRITGFLSTLVLAKTDFGSADYYPEPDGEFFNQSESIIGARVALGNLSKGRRTTEVIPITARKHWPYLAARLPSRAPG